MFPSHRNGAQVIHVDTSPALRKQTAHSKKNATVWTSSPATLGIACITEATKAATGAAHPNHEGTRLPSPSASSIPAKNGIIRTGKFGISAQDARINAP